MHIHPTGILVSVFFKKWCLLTVNNLNLCHETLDGAVWHNDIIILMAQLIGYFSYQQPISCSSTFKYLSSACCSSCSTHQKPSTFPSSTCIDLLQGNFVYVILRGYFIHVICTAAVFLTCSRQHVVDVLAVASLGTCSAAAAAAV